MQGQALSLLGERVVEEYRTVTQDASQAVPREETLTFVPHVPGIEFNPPSRSFRWIESVHREEFRLRAGAELVGQTARGRLSVFLSDILLADVQLAIPVDASAVPPAADAQQEAGLTTRTAGRRGLGWWRLGVGVFGAGGQRGVARGLVELVLQWPDRGEEGADDGLCFRRLAGNQLFGDLQRHALHVGEKQTCGQTNSQEPHPGPWPITRRLGTSHAFSIVGGTE